MADAVWPAGLDALAPQLVSWTKTEPKLTERTAMDAGPAKVRRRFTAGVTVHQVELVLTRTQLGVFRDFWTNTIEGGALAFEWREWESQDPCDFRFITEPVERPLRPRGSGSDDCWTVAFQLEQLPAVSGGGVTPPAPDNEPPPQLILDFPQEGLTPGEYIGYADVGYIPPANDPTQLDFANITIEVQPLNDDGFIAIPSGGNSTSTGTFEPTVTGQMPVPPILEDH